MKKSSTFGMLAIRKPATQRTSPTIRKVGSNENKPIIILPAKNVITPINIRNRSTTVDSVFIFLFFILSLYIKIQGFALNLRFLIGYAANTLNLDLFLITIVESKTNRRTMKSPDLSAGFLWNNHSHANKRVNEIFLYSH